MFLDFQWICFFASGYFSLTFEEGLNKKRGVETGSHQQDVI